MFEVVTKKSQFEDAAVYTVASLVEAKELAEVTGGKVRPLKLTPQEKKRAEMLASFGVVYTPKRGM